MHELIFDGVPSSSFGMIITGAGVYDTPARKFQKVSIEGRNGDLIIEDDPYDVAYENIEIRYPAIIYQDYRRNRMSLSTLLSAKTGYRELEDTFEPDRFRLATFSKMSNPKMTDHYDAGSFEITFDCKPQWFLKSGKDETTMTAGGILFNPTFQYAKPLIMVTGSGTIGLNDQTITVQNNNGTIKIDSETENCYDEVAFRNMNVSFSDERYPRLRPGDNNITLNGVTISIIPRWFEI